MQIAKASLKVNARRLIGSRSKQTIWDASRPSSSAKESNYSHGTTPTVKLLSQLVRHAVSEALESIIISWSKFGIGPAIWTKRV